MNIEVSKIGRFLVMIVLPLTFAESSQPFFQLYKTVLAETTFGNSANGFFAQELLS